MDYLVAPPDMLQEGVSYIYKLTLTKDPGNKAKWELRGKQSEYPWSCIQSGGHFMFVKMEIQFWVLVMQQT
jgi:hypothetical protein